MFEFFIATFYAFRCLQSLIDWHSTRQSKRRAKPMPFVSHHVTNYRTNSICDCDVRDLFTRLGEWRKFWFGWQKENWFFMISNSLNVSSFSQRRFYSSPIWPRILCNPNLNGCDDLIAEAPFYIRSRSFQNGCVDGIENKTSLFLLSSSRTRPGSFVYSNFVWMWPKNVANLNEFAVTKLTIAQKRYSFDILSYFRISF